MGAINNLLDDKERQIRELKAELAVSNSLIERLELELADLKLKFKELEYIALVEKLNEKIKDNFINKNKQE